MIMSEAVSNQIKGLNSARNDLQNKTRPSSNLNLRQNENSFHVLASLLIDFFQPKLVVNEDENSKNYTLTPEDKEKLQRLLPKTAIWDFIDAVNYRLEMTPIVPVSPIHFLTLQCQELCFDKEETMENPILATYTVTTVAVSIEIVTATSDRCASNGIDDTYDSGSCERDYNSTKRKSNNIDEDEDDSDGFVHTKGAIVSDSSDLSSDESGIKVESSKDITEEMMAENIGSNDVNNKNNATITILSDNDSMPTEYDGVDDFEELLVSVCGNEVNQLDSNIVKTQQQDISYDTNFSVEDTNQETSTKEYSENSIPTHFTIDGGVIINRVAKEENVTGGNNEEQIDNDIPRAQLDVVGSIEEGEEIEVLPTLTGTFDDETCITQEEPQSGRDKEVIDCEPKGLVDDTNHDSSKVEEIEVFPNSNCTIDDIMQITQEETHLGRDKEIFDCEPNGLIDENDFEPTALTGIVDDETYITQEEPQSGRDKQVSDCEPKGLVDETNNNSSKGKEIEVFPTSNYTDDKTQITLEETHLGRDKQIFDCEPNGLIDENDFEPTEGEEIEMLPTLSGTFDDQTQITQNEMQFGRDIEATNYDPSLLVDDNNHKPSKVESYEESIGEGIEVLPTETIEDDATSNEKLSDLIPAEVIDNTDAKRKVEEVQLHIAGRDRGLIEEDKTTNESTLDNDFDGAKRHTTSNDKQLESDLTDKIDPTYTSIPDAFSPKSQHTISSNDSVTRRMQDAAGAFFDELRWAIDEKVEAFENALVNAIVSKPIKRHNVPTEQEKSTKQPRAHFESIIIDADGNKTDQSKMEDLVHKMIMKTELSESSKNILNQSNEQTEIVALQPENVALQVKKGVPNQSNQRKVNATILPEEDETTLVKPTSPASFSVHSGIGSLLAGLASGFAPSVRGGESISSQFKTNLSSFPSDEGTTKEADLSLLDFSAYESMEVSDTTNKQQLLLELKEACTLMKQSITPETTRFWSDHIKILKSRLDALSDEKKQVVGSESVSYPLSIDKLEVYDQHLPIIPAVISDVQSTTAMSDIRSTKGIPVVQALSQFSNNNDGPNEYHSRYIEHTPEPNTIGYRDVGIENHPQQYQQSEIELSQSRNRFEPNPDEGINSQQLDPQSLVDNDEGYYEYPLVDVVAPADLPGGYHFEAEIEGQRFLATVPPGGVQQGETFTCFMKELDSVAIDIPVGDWKDGMFNMCELGWCHPVLWNAIFCPLIALGQIQTRVHLDFLGRPKFGDLPYTNRYMMLLVIAFWIGTNITLFAACNLKWSRGMELSVADGCAFALVNVVMFGFVVFVTQSTRSSVREKFMIRERCCYDLEDVCCATLCLPCSVGQMQRHTANYDDYEAVCCSKTGLPNGVRVNQEPAKLKETTIENDDGYMDDGYMV
jgi:Cys-rich protein (TIGR01571 family)